MAPAKAARSVLGKAHNHARLGVDFSRAENGIAQDFSTDAPLIPRTLLTPDSDSTDATRGYPPDSADDSNSLIQIAFRLALSVKSELQLPNEAALMRTHG